MSEPLHVLIVEDDENDALRIIRELHRGGFDPQYERVETAAALQIALREQRWDIILSDYKMPRFTGLDALKIYRETGMDIPFIIVSGTIGEDVAVEAMRAGAHDYIMKDRRQRLVPAIRRELREAAVRRERKRAEDMLWRNAMFLRSLIDSIPNPLFYKDVVGVYRECNQAFAAAMGLTREEIIDKTVYDVAPGDLAKRYQEMDEELVRQGGTQVYESVVRYPDGKRRNILFNKAVISGIDGKKDGIVGIMLDITDRKELEQELQGSLKRLGHALNSTVQAIVNIVETRDPYTAGHQRHVADLAVAIAGELGIDGNRMEGLRMAAAIHDLGKISVPAEILSKPVKLSPVEFKLIMMHSQIGFDILKDIDFPWPVASIVLQHHERFDGSGYPQGLRGEEILCEARIIAVADVVEAIASHRPYRAAFGIDIALAEIEENRGVLYQPEVVDACLGLFREKGYRIG